LMGASGGDALDDSGSVNELDVAHLPLTPWTDQHVVSKDALGGLGHHVVHQVSCRVGHTPAQTRWAAATPTDLGHQTLEAAAAADPCKTATGQAATEEALAASVPARRAGTAQIG
jgi:hypothetical protein